jgi:hypothetical protein
MASSVPGEIKLLYPNITMLIAQLFAASTGGVAVKALCFQSLDLGSNPRMVRFFITFYYSLSYIIIYHFLLLLIYYLLIYSCSFYLLIILFYVKLYVS